MSGISIEGLMQSVGLPELAHVSREEIATNLLLASIVGFSDGDIVSLHEPYTDPEKIRLYGSVAFNEGLVAKAMLAKALENGMKPGDIYDFQGFAAGYYNHPDSPFRDMPRISSARIYPEAITIDDNPIALPRPPQLVVEYGACLNSESMLVDQVNFASSGNRPFIYSPITRLHFTNRALMNSYDTNVEPGTSQLVVNNGLYIGREDGIGDASDEVIRANQAAGAPTDVADVILYNAGRHTTPDELRRGVYNAYAIVKETGMLVVRSFALPASDEIGTDEITGWAYDAGFAERSRLEYTAVSHGLGTTILAGLEGRDNIREIKTVVLSK